MIIIVDRYIIRTFLGPFLFIFSVLFFIFIVQIAWQELDKYLGKGFSVFQILKLLFYLGITTVQMVLPLTILLASIMTFGQLGENYELTALKASGVSLLRIMFPLFLLVTTMGIGLYYFSNNVVPSFQYKARNMIINIKNAKPALSFEPGKFIVDIPNYAMRINDISGEDNDQFKDIIIHSMTPLSENNQTIVATQGTLQPTDNKYYLKFELYDGYVYENENKNKNFQELKKQPNRIIKFDTLSRYFDISDLIIQAMSDESGTSHYKYLNYSQLNDTIQVMDSVKDLRVKSASNKIISNFAPNKYELDSLDFSKKYESKLQLNTLSENNLKSIAQRAISNLERNRNMIDNDVQTIGWIMRDKNKAVIYQQKMLSYSFTCIIFFLIGASLGSIIRKGGLGMPVVVAIIVFVVFFILDTVFYQSTKNNMLNPYLAAWLPNLIILPIALFFTFQAVNDSQVLDISKYQEPIRKISRKFGPKKSQEHQRYQ